MASELYFVIQLRTDASGLPVCYTYLKIICTFTGNWTDFCYYVFVVAYHTAEENVT